MGSVRSFYWSIIVSLQVQSYGLLFSVGVEVEFGTVVDGEVCSVVDEIVVSSVSSPFDDSFPVIVTLTSVLFSVFNVVSGNTN